MNELQKAAEILVECGYAQLLLRPDIVEVDGYVQCVDYLSDSLKGRRQADAIENWLNKRQLGLWCVFSREHNPIIDNRHQWRLARIKWCLQELSK